jgi:hypothetical protein
VYPFKATLRYEETDEGKPLWKPNLDSNSVDESDGIWTPRGHNAPHHVLVKYDCEICSLCRSGEIYDLDVVCFDVKRAAGPIMARASYDYVEPLWSTSSKHIEGLDSVVYVGWCAASEYDVEFIEM